VGSEELLASTYLRRKTYLVEGWVKHTHPPCSLHRRHCGVAGGGQNPENEHERLFRGCPTAAVVAGWKGAENTPLAGGFRAQRAFSVVEYNSVSLDVGDSQQNVPF